MSTNSIDVRVSQAYLDLARSYTTAVAHSKVSDLAQPEGLDQANRTTTTFAFAALSTVFSYAAIEAVVNHELYHIWEDARHAHDVIETIQRSDPSRRYVPILDRFYNKYGKLFPFKKLKSTDLRDLTERIKTVCRAYDFPPLPKTNPKLWDNLLRLEETRHQLIHPTPEQAEFGKLIERLLSTEPYESYPQTACNVIRFLYESAKCPVPDYLDGNKLFRITGIEVFF